MQKWNKASTYLFRRPEKAQQLDDSLIRLEQRIGNIKNSCQAVGKKLLACLQLHGVDQDKRSKKLPDSVLSKQLQESSFLFNEDDAFRKTLSLCGQVEEVLADQKISYEAEIEKNVLQPLQNLIEKEIPSIVKLRKLVLKQTQEVETLKSRHSAITRQSMLPQEGAKKFTQAQEEMEEAVNKLELYIDQLATEMYNFYAKEGDLSNIFIALIESQLRYHTDASAALKQVLPEMKTVAERSAQQPVFGVALEDHLRYTNQPIASVLSECITALLNEGMQLEGLFRIAGGATKSKKLRAAFDAGMVNMDEFMIDPHCVAGVLKLYLRELPEPLMTFELYNDWAKAAQLSSEQRIYAIAEILKKMRRPHFDNLKFLIQFLSRLAENVEVNKMSASNLAIVVGPNLLWSQAGDEQNILATGVQSAITETMISNSVQLFGDDPEFGMMPSDGVSSMTTNSSSSSRDVSSSGIAKQTMKNVDSSDSLSSDSLGADSSTTVAIASNSLSSDMYTVTRNIDVDFTNPVPPKRTGKKTHAPLPPSYESTLTLATAFADVSNLIPTASGEQAETNTLSKTKSETGGDRVEQSNPQIHVGATKVTITAAQPRVTVEAKTVTTTIPAEETKLTSQRKVGVAEVSSSHEQEETLAEDKTATPPNAKKPTRFAANQALVSNMLTGGRKTLLTRPNTTYMDQAKFELLKTAEEQNEGETLPKMEAGESVSVGSSKDADVHSKETIGVRKDDRAESKDAQLTSEMLAAADVPKATGQEDENKDVVTQKLNEEHSRKKPERPSKPIRILQSEEVGGNVSKSDSGSKVAQEQHGNAAGKEEPILSQPSNHESSTIGSKTGSQDAQNSGHQQRVVGGVPPPKPPPPATGGSRPSSSSNADENTYL